MSETTVAAETLASERADSTQAIYAWQNEPDEPLVLPVGAVAELQYYLAGRRAKLAAMLVFTAVAAAVLVVIPAPRVHAPVGIAPTPIIAPMPPSPPAAQPR